MSLTSFGSSGSVRISAALSNGSTQAHTTVASAGLTTSLPLSALNAGKGSAVSTSAQDLARSEALIAAQALAVRA